MSGLTSLDVVYIALIFVVPGFIIRAVRAQFVIEQDRTGVDQFVRLLAYSSINNAAFGSAIYLAFPYNLLAENKILVWSFLILIAPAVSSIASGASSQRQLLYKLLCWCKLRPIHVVPNAWDYKFSQAGGEFICVTTKDDKQIGGWWVNDSFASSDSKERDILIGQVYDIHDDKPWEPTGKSTLIVAGEVKRIEFQRPKIQGM